MINLSVLSVGEYKKIAKRKKFRVSYGFCTCAFGKCLIGLHNNQICHFSFVTKSESENFAVLKKQWAEAELVGEKKETSKTVKKMFDGETNSTLDVLLKGSSFEAKVWHGLLSVSKGETVSYSELARKIGEEKAVRAVANAVAKNFAAYLIPCHRVIRKDGKVHNYRWGESIKKKILQFEGSIQ